jgi:hypothetical protein
MKISKIISIIVVVVGLIGGVMWLMMNSTIGDMMTDAGVNEARELPLADTIPVVSPIYNLGWIIFAIIAVVTIVALIMNLAKNPKSLKKIGINFAVFAVIVAISYAIADSTPMLLNKDTGEMTSNAGSKWAGAGLYAFYILGAVAVAMMLSGAMKKLINK